MCLVCVRVANKATALQTMRCFAPSASHMIFIIARDGDVDENEVSIRTHLHSILTCSPDIPVCMVFAFLLLVEELRPR